VKLLFVLNFKFVFIEYKYVLTLLVVSMYKYK
jgi:hypothetical protein